MSSPIQKKKKKIDVPDLENTTECVIFMLYFSIHFVLKTNTRYCFKMCHKMLFVV